MKKLLSFLSLYLFFCFINVQALRNSMLFMGNVQFPLSLEAVPDMRIYWFGNKIKGEIQHESRKLTFAIPDERQRNQFYLLITPTIKYALKDQNTIAYLSLAKRQTYKFYRLKLVQRLTGADTAQLSNQYSWEVKEQKLPPSARIPDDTIIVCYNPDFVEKVQGGNAIELPTITIKPNIVSLLGSESMLHDKSIEMMLACLDHDALHMPIQQEVKQDIAQKTILAVTI